jgi:hypothetical protein
MSKRKGNNYEQQGQRTTVVDEIPMREKKETEDEDINPSFGTGQNLD